MAWPGVIPLPGPNKPLNNMEIVKLKLADLESNIGQIPDLPMNPRQWTQSDIDSLARSLEETPELFEARPLLVVPHEGKFVILGGNLRFEAAKHNKAKTAPAIVFPENTPITKLKEIVIKDNGSFGSWDYDILANEWDDLPLADWGVPVWDAPKEEKTQGEGEQGSTASSNLLLQFAGKKVLMTEDEQEQLLARYEEYISNTGTYFGFVADLLGVTLGE